MRKKWLFGLVCALLLTGCGPGRTAPITNSSSSDSAFSGPDVSGLPADHGTVPLEFPEGEVPEGTVVEYTWDHPVTVDQGRQLTVRLRCEAEYSGYCWYYSVTSMDLMEGETFLRTLSIQLADAAALFQEGWDPDYAADRTHCHEPDGGLILEDLNFDGIPDLRLLEATGTVNSRYLCWLWDPGPGKFCFAFSLVGYDIQVDAEQEQIITTARDAGTHITNCYQYDREGILRLADTQSVTPGQG